MAKVARLPLWLCAPCFFGHASIALRTSQCLRFVFNAHAAIATPVIAHLSFALPPLQVEENEAAIGSLLRAEASGGTPKAAAVAAALEARPHRPHTAIAVDPLTPAEAPVHGGGGSSIPTAAVGEAIFSAPATEPAESRSARDGGAGSSFGDSSSDTGSGGRAVSGGKQVILPPQHRRVRSRDEMAAEAQLYRETAARMGLLPVV